MIGWRQLRHHQLADSAGNWRQLKGSYDGPHYFAVSSDWTSDENTLVFTLPGNSNFDKSVAVVLKLIEKWDVVAVDVL
eukprot:IDg20985t1